MSRARPGPYEISSTEVVKLQSKVGGEAIEIGVVRPNVPGGRRVPVIVLATPYFNHALTEDSVAQCAPRLVDNFVQHGYAIGLVSVRGTSGSGGCSDLTGPAERADLDQAITWLGERPWSNAHVGMIGLSYDGATAWEVASMGNKYLKTIVPMSGVNDFFDLLYRHGIPEYRSLGLMNMLYFAYPFFPGDPMSRTAEQSARSALCPEVVEGLAAAIQSGATGERDATGFWAERNSRPGVEKKFKGSIFIARGLQDWNVDPAHDLPWVHRLARQGTYVKYMLGQWEHHFPDSTSEDEVMDPGEPVRWDWADILLQWWDRWLKDDKTARLGPRVEVQDSARRWRREDSWPPSDARPTDYFLTAEGQLSEKATPGSAQYPVAFDYNKLSGNYSDFTCTCPRFKLETSSRELRFAGSPELVVSVIPLGPGGHISAFLYAGDQLLGWGAVDLRFPNGGEQAQPVEPGEPLKVRLALEPLDAVVPPGKELTLVVAQSGYGGDETLTYRNSAMVFPLQLRVGGKTSRLRLNTFTRAKGFFEPPKRPRPIPQ